MQTTLPKGFQLATLAAGFRKAGKPDFALAVSDVPASAAGVFTTNLFKAAPVLVARDTLRKNGHTARAVVVNTGQANACTGAEGMDNCLASIAMVAEAAGLAPETILPASTGVIGAQLQLDKWKDAVPELCRGLGKSTVEDFASAIMTTDSFPKYYTEQVALVAGKVTLTGVAKGAGMICPDMATMISVVLCDAEVAPDAWQAMFERAVKLSFNRATVDGDTSTNDSLFGLANGASGVAATKKDLDVLEASLVRVLQRLAYMLVADGEGATKVMHIHVRGTATDADAELAARTVGNSQLVKTAMYGKDANWGRIIAALGRSGAAFHPQDVRVMLCGVEIFANEQPASDDFDELLKDPLEQRDLHIDISLGSGKGSYTLMASDLTHEYVSINADYRS